jgi:hypothetical protein
VSVDNENPEQCPSISSAVQASSPPPSLTLFVIDVP